MYLEAARLVLIALAFFVTWGLLDYLWRHRKD